MHPSFSVLIAEYIVYGSCMTAVIYAAGNVIIKFMKADLTSAASDDNLYKYSSIIALITSAIIAIMIHQLTSKYYNYFSDIENINIYQFILTAFGLLLIGYVFMHYVLLKYYSLFSSYQYDTTQYFAKNFLMVFISTALFCLLLAAPSLMDSNNSILRYLYFCLFIGASFRYLLASHGPSNMKKILANIIKPFM